MRVLTVGETMALLDPLEGGLHEGALLTLRIAGAESNVGVGLSRLGVETAWISRLGTDPFGDLVLSTLAGEGLDLTWARRDREAPTGVFFKWRSEDRSRVLYYRRGSAASKLEPSDVPDEAFDGVALVHLTGITTALSSSAYETVLDVARRARERSATVVFDPNWRPALWSGPEEAAAAQRAVLPYVDWYLCGAEEGRALFGTSTPEETLRAIVAAGARDAVVRSRSRGTLVRVEGELRVVASPTVASVLDEIGAGDGFAAGFIYGLLHGWSPQESVRAGKVVAIRALAGTGDWETLPRLEEVRAELSAARVAGLNGP
jgi:2-dehydro-3-deoxygluconokinase